MGEIEDGPRARLLAAAVDYLAEHGAQQLSLRALAAGIGTSHRMLIHHFGSKDGLLVAVVREVERRQREQLAELATLLDHGADPADVMRRFWRQLADPAMWPRERLFFDMYVRALHGGPAGELLDGIVESWLDPLVAVGMPAGLTRRAARARGRLAVAVARGLLLDLLATGDRKGVDDAVEAWIALATSESVSGRSRPSPSPPTPPRQSRRRADHPR